jgi:hypoxanthine phosphoribosyltransferase
MRFICPSWDWVYSQSITLAEKLLKRHGGDFDAIVGVSRGGLPLTRIMSDLLSVQNVMITRCEYYTDVGTTLRRPVITQKIQGDISRKKVLLVDDVADSGESLLVLRNYLFSKKPKEITLATLYIKPWAKTLPDYYVSKTSAWIVFPWELLEAMKYVNAKSGFSAIGKIGLPQVYLKRLSSFDEGFKRKVR